MLSKVASSTIYWVFGITWPGIEPRSPGLLVNTQLIRLMGHINGYQCKINSGLKIHQNSTCINSVNQYTQTHTHNTHTHTHTYIYIYIYTHKYCHPETDCFVLSELFSVARHAGRSKPGSKPTQLYVRLSLRQFGQQAYHVCLRELLRYLCSNSSSVRLLCPLCNGYRHEKMDTATRNQIHIALILLGKVWIILFSLQLWVNS